MKKTAIIITTFNQEKLLEKCISSVKKKTDYGNYRIFLVDDGSKDNTGEKIKKKFPFVYVTINKINQGFSKANNTGIKKALKEYNPDYVLLLNDDTEVVQGNWLSEMIKVGEKNPGAGILGCRIIYPDGSLQNIGGYIKRWEITKLMKAGQEKIIDVDHVMGSCMLIKRKVIDKIGGLDEIFTPYLLEDTDYCLRAKKAGFYVKNVSYVKIIHKKGKTIDSLKSKKSAFIRFKNDMIFSCRHLGFRNALFRIFIYLPMVAAFRKKTDESELKLRNFRVRKDFLINFFILSAAYIYFLKNIGKVKIK